MKMISLFLMLVVSPGGLFGCSQVPQLEPHLASEATPSPVELIRASNLIVLATVVSENLIGPTVEIGNEHVRLQRIDLDVEGVLKGKTDSSRISFYRYRWYDDWIKQSPTIDSIMPGERSIFFLNRTDDMLRAAFDVTVSRVRVLSGRHDFASLSDRPLEERIAYLMLTPGSDVSSDAFGEGLATQALDAMTLVGTARTLEFLKPLLQHPSEMIRADACLTMARWFDGQSKCLSDLPSDGTGRFSPQAIRTVIEANERRDASLREKLRKGDIQALERTVMGHNAAGVCDHLRAVTEHQDPEIAKLATSLLEKQFPDAVRSGCPAIF